MTRDRPQSLATCLESYQENLKRHGRSAEFIVAEDSRTAEGAQRTKASLTRIAREFHARLRYAGAGEKRQFAESLAAESDVSHEIIWFALFGDDRCPLRTGANRNSLLLDTAGRLALAVDDDTICAIAEPPGREAALSFFPAYDPTEFWFFPDRSAAVQSVSSIDMDVLGCHEDLLGSDVAGPGGGASGRVVMTLHGLIGDSGMASPRHYLTLTGASRERLVASREVYRSAFTSREILRTVRQPTLARGPFCMTTFLGLDNRFLLPPFFPVQRNSDGIFGQMLHKYVDGSHTAFLPWTLRHAPQPPRQFKPNDLWTAATTLRMSDLVIDSVLAKETRTEDVTTAARLIDLGKHLEWLGELSVLDFEDCLRGVQQIRNFGIITALHSQLQSYGPSPGFWAEDVSRMIELTSRASSAEDYMTATDLPRSLGADQAGRLAQELVRKYGSLLQAWPALFEAAMRLAGRGCRLSVALNG